MRLQTEAQRLPGRRMLCRALLILALSLLAVPAGARSQPQSLDALARALARKLPHKRGLVVFVGPSQWQGKGGKYALGQRIGTELAATLSAADPTAAIQSPDETIAALGKAGFGRLNALILARMAPAAAEQKHGASAVGVESAIREEGSQLALTVSAVRFAERKPFAKLTALLPESAEWRALLALPEKPFENRHGVYLPGVGGIGPPHCLRCRSPRFSRRAIRSRKGGSVLLAITVTANGTVKDVTVLRGLPGSGLDQEAVRAARGWRFRPAEGPDGKPVPVHMGVVMNFRLIRRRHFHFRRM